jgi:CubicO group peptidase (beta-lactamase class C family)
MIDSDGARRVIDEAIRKHVFPGAAIEVGDGASAMWTDARGTLTFDAQSGPATTETPFDLASLTKVIATTTVIMDLVRTGALRLDERVSAFFVDWRAADREAVTVRDLLEHASGLPARLLDPPPAGRREFEHDISTMPLEHPPRSRSIYSDLGFILLGFLAADRGSASLTELFERLPVVRSVRLQPDRDGITVRLKADTTSDAFLAFALPPDARRLAAPTRPLDEDARRGRLLVGDVHDNYAAALGGVAGHAGLFGTASAIGAFARALLRASHGDQDSPPPFLPACVADFLRKSTVPGSSRALGWDTMLPTSSCGTRMSPQAFGHVGFTGTSLWIDPVRDRYFVLLTNRVCGGGTIEDMRTVRRAFHDALGNV